MRPSKRVQAVVIFVATLLFLGGLSTAQEPKANDWGNSVRGLQMRIYLDQAASGPAKVPSFKVEFRNVREKDLLLNLGSMTHNGGQQYVTAVSLILVDPQGKPHWLELKRTLLGSDVRKEPLFLPLPVGATFSFPVELDNYWAVATSKEFDYIGNRGPYRIVAHLRGFIDADNRMTIRTEGPGLQPVAGRSFDMVNPEIGFGPPPTSNALQFEVPIR
jgi:hypothetical protein